MLNKLIYDEFILYAVYVIIFKMNILFLGDIVGEPGRAIVKKYLNLVKNKFKIDFTIVNGENATHGKGLNPEHYEDLLSQGVDCITMGNHFFGKTNPQSFYLKADRLIRPLNIHPSASGVGSRLFNCKGLKIRVTNILGRVMMNELSFSSPFDCVDKLINEKDYDIHIVDFHAEATSEKIAFAYNYSKDLTAVLGTHTHVQTADERILNNYCGFITDVGMNGPYDSVIGAHIEQIIHKTKTGLRKKFEVATGNGIFQAVVLHVSEDDGRTLSIERVQIRPNEDRNF